MKTKDISFDPDASVASVEVIVDPVRGERKAILRRRTLLPIPVKPMEVRDIAEIRRRLNVRQAVFASLMNVSRVTAIRWEKRCRRECCRRFDPEPAVGWMFWGPGCWSGVPQRGGTDTTLPLHLKENGAEDPA